MSRPLGVANEDAVKLTGAERKDVRRRSFRLLATLALPQKKLFILTIVLVLFTNAARVLLPVLIALAIDWTLPQVRQGNWASLGVTGGAYILCAILAGVLLSWYIKCAAKISQAMLLELRQKVFRHTQRLRCDADAAGIQHRHGDLEPFAFFAQPIFHRHAIVLIHNLGRGRRANT